jgi:hypothetical protein
MLIEYAESEIFVLWVAGSSMLDLKKIILKCKMKCKKMLILRG